MHTHNAVISEGRVVHIRNAIVQDASEISRLLTQLGHATSTAEVEHRWAEWEEQGNSMLVAYEDGPDLIALCQLHQTVVLHRPKPIGRITSLIVEETRRGQGIGRVLMATAEARFLLAGCGLVELTSNLKRVEAHAFYESIGYVKTSVRLAKSITQE